MAISNVHLYLKPVPQCCINHRIYEATNEKCYMQNKKNLIPWASTDSNTVTNHKVESM